MSERITVEEHPWPAVLMHWTHLVSFLALVVTGILIHQAPLNFPMQTVRTVHFVMMFIFIATTVVRVYWAIVGRSANSGQIEKVPDYKHFVVEQSNRGLFWQYVKYYTFLRKTRPPVVKYNPLQKMTYSVLFPLGVIWMTITGFALFVNTQPYFQWLTDLVGNLNGVRVWHYFGMWVMVVFFMIHFYLVLVEEPKQFLTMLFHYSPSESDGSEKGNAGTEPSRT